MEKQDYVDTEELEVKIKDLSDTYKIIGQDFEDQQVKIAQVTKQEDEIETLQSSLLFKLKKLTNCMSESCLVQLIAILFCVLVILLIKL